MAGADPPLQGAGLIGAQAPQSQSRAAGARIARAAVYGAPPQDLAPSPPGAVQVSPLIPGAASLEAAPDASLDLAAIAAPAGTLERRYVLAQALRALAAGGVLEAAAPKAKGGGRLRGELEAFGCEVAETYGGGQRACRVTRPEQLQGVAAAIEAGGPQRPPALGLWSQPGVFSWDRLDPGTALLLEHVADLAGSGADFGCGVGPLALRLVEGARASRLLLIDVDARAIAAARRNIDDARASFLQADLGAGEVPGLERLDFVVMNPPFHAGGAEDRGIGGRFVERAAAALRPGGVCRLVANVALPYERALGTRFTRVAQVARRDGYKVLEAVR